MFYEITVPPADEMANVVHQPPAAVQKTAHVKSLDEYRTLYEKSIKDPAVSLYY